MNYIVGGHLFHNQFGKNMIYTRDLKKYAKMLIEMCVIEEWLKNYASLIWVSSIFPLSRLSLTLMIKSWVWPLWYTKYPLWIIGKKNPVTNHVQSTMEVNQTNPGLWLGWNTKPCPDQSVTPFNWNV